MLWSTPPIQLAALRGLLTPDKLQHTNLLSNELTERGYRHKSVKYFEIPPVAHQLSKLVVAYAFITPTGHLSPTPKPFYAVTKRPSNAGIDKPVVTRRLQQGHVLAEDLSLRRGIFTPDSRETTEPLIAGLMPDAYRDTYVEDRILHLGALATEAHETNLLGKRERDLVVKGLRRGINALNNL